MTATRSRDDLCRVHLPAVDDGNATRLADLAESLAGLTKDCGNWLPRYRRSAPSPRRRTRVSQITSSEVSEGTDSDWWRLEALFPNESALGPSPPQ